MRLSGTLGLVAIGITLGVCATAYYLGQPRPAAAASNDRYTHKTDAFHECSPFHIFLNRS